MKYFIAIFVIAAMLVGCQQQKKSEQAEQQQPQQVEQAKYTLDELASNICPGCGMVLKTNAEIADTAHYKGKVYGFCGPKCKDAFKANPEKTLASMHERMEKMEGMQEGHEESEEHEHSEM